MTVKTQMADLKLALNDALTQAEAELLINPGATSVRNVFESLREELGVEGHFAQRHREREMSR